MAVRAVKAVFTDMDGTLLNPASRISDYTVSTLTRLKQKGIPFVVCTGRPYVDVCASAHECGLSPDYFITSNGAVVHDGSGKLLHEHALDPLVIQRLTRITQLPDEHGCMPAAASSAPAVFCGNYYQRNEWLTDHLVPEAVATMNPALTCRDMGSSFHTQDAAALAGIHHFWFMSHDAEALRRLRLYLAREFESQGLLTMTSSHPALIEIGPCGIDKGVAVKDVCARIGLSPADVACFGDGLNDVAMLQVAGHAFVMANASPEVKAAVSGAEVILSNEADGVAKKLQQLLA